MIFQHAKRSVCQFGRRVSAVALVSGWALFTGHSAFSASVNYARFPASEDVHVKSGFAGKKNFGSEPALELQNNRGTVSEAFVKFNLAGVDRNLREARLRIYLSAEKAEATTVLIRSTLSGAWAESDVTWKDKPEHFHSIASIQLATLVAGWYEVDITSFIKTELSAGNDKISLGFLIGDQSSNKITIASRESLSNAPEIITSRPLYTAKVVFQPKEKATPTGYIADSGAPFGPRTGTGKVFGWSADVAAFVKDRNKPAQDDPPAAKGPDVRYMGSAFMDHAEMKQPAFWEMAVPNGKYKVHVVAGDATFYDSIYAVDVEGVTIAEGIPDSTRRWVEGTQIVVVKDGKLTVNNHSKGINNKLCFLEIAEVAGP